MGQWATPLHEATLLKRALMATDDPPRLNELTYRAEKSKATSNSTTFAANPGPGNDSKGRPDPAPTLQPDQRPATVTPGKHTERDHNKMHLTAASRPYINFVDNPLPRMKTNTPTGQIRQNKNKTKEKDPTCPTDCTTEE